MIEKLGQVAAIAARDGIEAAISGLEQQIRVKLEDINPAAREYFVERLKQDKAAIQQLKKLCAEMHGRVFDAYKEENPV